MSIYSDGFLNAGSMSCGLFYLSLFVETLSSLVKIGVLWENTAKKVSLFEIGYLLYFNIPVGLLKLHLFTTVYSCYNL